MSAPLITFDCLCAIFNTSLKQLKALTRVHTTSDLAIMALHLAINYFKTSSSSVMREYGNMITAGDVFDDFGFEWTITTLSGGFLVTNWLVREQQMLRDIGFSVFCRFNSKPT